MIKTARHIILVISILIMAYILPLLFTVIFEPLPRPVLISYSTVNDQFLINQREKGKTRYTTSDGQLISKEKYYASLPVFYYRKLEKEGLLPDSIQGEVLTVNNLKKHSYFFRLNHGDIFEPQPVELPLIESTNESNHFELSALFFRFKNNIQLFNVNNGQILQNPSEAFTRILKDSGFVFPSKRIYYDVRPQKNYDTGYYLIDYYNHLFTLHMENGRPLVDIVKLPRDLHIKYILCTDPLNMEFNALILDSKNNIYLHLGTTNRVYKTDITGFNPETDDLMIFGNQFNKTFSIKNNDSIRLFIINDNYETFRSFNYPLHPKKTKRFNATKSLLFPFTVQLNIKKNQLIVPALSFSNSWLVFLFNAVLLIVYVMVYKRKLCITDAILVLLTGIYGFIAVVFVKKV